MDRHEYLNERDAQIRAARSKLGALSEKAAGGPGFAPEHDQDPTLQELGEALDAAEMRLAEVRRANERGWHLTRIEADEAMMGVNSAMKQALSRIV